MGQSIHPDFVALWVSSKLCHLGFRVQGLHPGVCVYGYPVNFGIEGLGSRVQGLGFMVYPPLPESCRLDPPEELACQRQFTQTDVERRGMCAQAFLAGEYALLEGGRTVTALTPKPQVNRKNGLGAVACCGQGFYREGDTTGLDSCQGKHGIPSLNSARSLLPSVTLLHARSETSQSRIPLVASSLRPRPRPTTC